MSVLAFASVLQYPTDFGQLVIAQVMPLGARTGFKKKSYGFKETVSIAKPAGVTEITLEPFCACGFDLQEAQAQRLKKKYPFSCHCLLHKNLERAPFHLLILHSKKEF